MSENPAAFNTLRHVAYGFVNEHGKNHTLLEEACREFMRANKEGSDFSRMSEREVNQLIKEVVGWTIRKYNPPRRKAERSREERAAVMILAPELFEMAAEIFGKSTVRNAAKLSGQSKSTLARHLALQGVAPRRENIIRKLPSNTQKLLRILDETFSRRSEGVLKIAELSDAIWRTSASPVPRSTLASRRKSLFKMLEAIRKCNIGYHTLSKDEFVIVRRGRNFTSLSEAASRIDERFRVPLVIPKDGPKTNFWADPYILHIIEILDMSATQHFYPPERLDSIFFFKRPLLDTTPLYPWLHRAYFCDYSSNMGESLFFLSDNIFDKTVQRAACSIAHNLQHLAGYCGIDSLCCDAVTTICSLLDVMDHADQHAPESFCRLAHFRAMLETREETYLEIRDEINGMLARERSGDWQAPDAEALKTYLTVQRDQ
jgi:bacterioferritin-associated ferredoxin